MATSLTSPGLVFAADKAIIQARKALEKLSLFTTDFSADAVQPGTSLKIPVYSGTAVDFNAGSSAGYNDAEGAIKWASLPFETHKKCTFGISNKDKLLVETDPMWANAGKAAGQAVGQALLSAATSKLVYSAATQVTGWSATLANLAALRKSCADNDLDPARCVVMLEPATYATILALLPANVLGSDTAIVDGIAKGLYGFKAVIEANTISTTSASGVTNGVGFVVPEDALAIGARVIDGSDTSEEWGAVTDEVTGLTLGHRVTVDQNAGIRYYTVEGLIGAALTRDASNNAPKFLQLVTA